MELVFKRQAQQLIWIDGTKVGDRIFLALSEVRNELNGERPDPSRLPDTETSFTAKRTVGPVVMPRPFPLGLWPIYGTEDVSDGWTRPAQILTGAHQSLAIWNTDPLTGCYMVPSGEFTDDWCYWLHYLNGSHHTDGCIGMWMLSDFQEVLAGVRLALSEKETVTVEAVI